MRTWVDTDANGIKLTDGRVCLVIKSDEDPTMPEVRTYGKDREEVLDKIAKTVETAQTQIHRLRSNSAPAARPASTAPSATDMAAAVANMNNPAKVGDAIKTVLRSVGVDVDANAQREAAKTVSNICAAWEKDNPDFPNEPRNQRMLIDRAIILAGGKYLSVTAKELSAAFEELTRQEMFFEVVKPVQPSGSPDSRTAEPARNASSYRRNSLRSPEPPAAPRVSEKEARWITILEKGHGKALDDAIRNEPGFEDFVNKYYAKTA